MQLQWLPGDQRENEGTGVSCEVMFAEYYYYLFYLLQLCYLQ